LAPGGAVEQGGGPPIPELLAIHLMIFARQQSAQAPIAEARALCRVNRFSADVLGRRVIQHRLGQQLLEPPVLNPPASCSR
jgi:hypothetical protein